MHRLIHGEPTRRIYFDCALVAVASQLMAADWAFVGDNDIFFFEVALHEMQDCWVFWFSFSYHDFMLVFG